LGDRAGTAFLALAPENVSKTGLALALRPAIHAIAEGARAAAFGRDRPHLDPGVGGDHAGKNLEARSGKMPGHILHLDRIAQIGLVVPIFADRVAVGDLGKLGGDRLALAELLENPAQNRLDGIEDIILGNEAHLDIELIELARAAV